MQPRLTDAAFRLRLQGWIEELQLNMRDFGWMLPPAEAKRLFDVLYASRAAHADVPVVLAAMLPAGSA